MEVRRGDEACPQMGAVSYKKRHWRSNRFSARVCSLRLRPDAEAQGRSRDVPVANVTMVFFSKFCKVGPVFAKSAKLKVPYRNRRFDRVDRSLGAGDG
jgi:hypothetical protein